MRRILFVSLIVLLAACSDNKPKLIDIVAHSWNYVSAKDSLGNDFKKVSPTDILLLRNDNGKTSFKYDIEKENIHASGTWELKDSTLAFTYNLAPKFTGIDSTVYSVSDGKPVLIYFKEGKEITRVDTSGVNSQHTIRYFRITECSDTRMVFTEKGITFVFSYQSQVNEGSVSLESLLRGILGIATLLALLFLLSANKKEIPWKVVWAGLLMQILFAIGVLKVPFVQHLFEWLSSFFVIVLQFTREGSTFVFNGLMNTKSSGFIFAFQILPTIIFFSAITSMLFYMGILQKIVYGLAWLMGKTMKISGAENLSTAANIFLGQTEAPLLIKHFIPKMTRSEILCIMIGGMANTAGGVLAAYVGFLGGDDPVQQLFFAKHLLAASVMSAPATIVVSKMMLPQTSPIDEKIELTKEKLGSNILEAIANGTQDGLRLAVNVAAMLIVFIALIAMANYIMKDVIGSMTGLNQWVENISTHRYHAFTLEFLLGYACAPLTWLMGVSSHDMVLVGQLLGEKTILNEFVAYISMGEMKVQQLFSDPKSLIMSTYILSGFANFASIGIQIGGIGALAPNQRSTLSQLGIRALIGGTIASLFTAVIVGMII